MPWNSHSLPGRQGRLCCQHCPGACSAPACRRKSENPAWRLHYVVTNPPWEEPLEPHDRVFVLREKGGAWLLDDSSG